jgi:hypothetical protein
MTTRATTFDKGMSARLVTVEEMRALWAQTVHARRVREKQTAALITGLYSTTFHNA